MSNTLPTIVINRNLFAVVRAGRRFPEGSGRACLLLGRSPAVVARLMGFRPDGTVTESAYGFSSDGGVGDDAQSTALVHIGPAPADPADRPVVRSRPRAPNALVLRAFDRLLAEIAGERTACRTRRASVGAVALSAAA